MNVRRRSFLGVLAGGGVALLGGAAPAEPLGLWSLSGEYAVRLRTAVTRFLQPTADHPRHPSYPGAAVFAEVDGRAVAHFAVGDAVRYGADGVLLPAARRIPATTRTLYDLASLTKLFTTVLVLQLVDRGEVALDAPVRRYLPDFIGKPAVTVRMLLAHTSGLSQDLSLVGVSRTERLARVLRDPVRAVPGTRFRYVDTNFVVLGVLAERLTGQRLDTLVRRRITEPLGMRDTMFRPARELWGRVAATEDARRGTVHDPISAALDGIAGHAGLFSTAYDLGVFGAALIDGHRLGLCPATVAAMRTDQNTRLGPDAAHGLGVDVDQSWYMGRLTGPPPAAPVAPLMAGRVVGRPAAFGHTGFTGTSLVVEPVRRVVLVLLTNRVHPDRRWGGINAARRAAADALAG